MLHIARIEKELGTLTEGEAVEMLQTGFLSPEDLYRVEGAAEWKPLSALRLESGIKSPSTLDQARQKLVAAGNAAASQATQFAEKLKHVATRSKAGLTDSASRMLDSYVPQIHNLVAVQLAAQSLTRAQAAMRDDEFMRKVFGATYDCLPRPVARFIGEEEFIQFCLERRRKLLAPDDGAELKQARDDWADGGSFPASNQTFYENPVAQSVVVCIFRSKFNAQDHRYSSRVLDGSKLGKA